MSVGSPTAGTWSSSLWRPDNEFETDSRRRLMDEWAAYLNGQPQSDTHTVSDAGLRRGRVRHIGGSRDRYP